MAKGIEKLGHSLSSPCSKGAKINNKFGKYLILFICAVKHRCTYRFGNFHDLQKCCEIKRRIFHVVEIFRYYFNLDDCNKKNLQCRRLFVPRTIPNPEETVTFPLAGDS